MESSTGILSTDKVQKAIDLAVELRMGKVNQKANDAIKSFAELVEQITKLKNDSNGTTIKKDVAALATDMNNSSVMMTRMLTAQLQALHDIVRPGDLGQPIS